MVGTQENLLFRREQDFERERRNQPIGACLPLSLSIFFLFFCSKIPLSYLFFLLFLFLNTCSVFPGFEIPNPLILLFPNTWQRTPFIVPVVTGFYYFGPQQSLSGLGVFADHHWSICVPLPIARQRKTILFVCLPWHPFLLWSGCILSPYPSWHAPSGSNSVLLLFGGMSSQQHTSPKRAWAGTLK